MNNQNFLKLVIVLLIVINLFTLGFIWFRTSGPPHRGDRPEDFLNEKLKFTSAQREQFDMLRKSHHESVMEMDRQAKELHHRFFSLLKTESADSLTPVMLADSIAQNRMQVEMITFHHFKEVRKICDPAQQTKFDEIIWEMLERLQGPRKPGPPPGH